MTNLDPQEVQVAEYLAFVISRSGLADEAAVRDQLKSWKETTGGSSFATCLNRHWRLEPAEMEAALQIARSCRDKGEATVQAAVATWANLDTLSPETAHDGQKSSGNAATSSASVDGADRFRIVSEYRRGGLGEVFIAEDQQFHRQVALKRIKSRFAGNNELCHRFRVEAELTGGLEHPGIVPVYELGATQDGSPFYAMKFVQGESLADALTKFHADPEKSFDSLMFRKLVQRFISACYTVHFSHTRGVLHRDIKPDNIMLGDFDETLVVEWGIAKVFGTKNTKSADQLKTSTFYPEARNSDGTQLGRIIGTPGYMSGEQALGWHDSLSPESDVFSLGATLYSMLVNSIPHDAPTADEMLQKTIAGDLTPPRVIDASVPRPLEAICLKATAQTKTNRYPSAQALAHDLELWLAGEPVSAWEESWLVRAGRWIGKHRTAVMTAAIAMTILTVGALIASLVLALAT